MRDARLALGGLGPVNEATEDLLEELSRKHRHENDIQYRLFVNQWPMILVVSWTADGRHGREASLAVIGGCLEFTPVRN